MNKFLSFFIVTIFLLVNEIASFTLTMPTRTYKSIKAIKMAVTEVTSTTALDAAVAAAGGKLVVVDYSTTWCGPCKIVLPKFVELSDKHDGVIFLKCIGDTSTEASQLMKREGVRSVPSFHFWKNGGKFFKPLKL